MRFQLVLRLLVACGVIAPALALAATLTAMAVHPEFNPARQYLSELGGAAARMPQIFNGGVLVAGVLAGAAGAGFGLAAMALGGARVAGALTLIVFILAGAGLATAAVYPWPDPRHLAINLALGIQIAPLLLLWALRRVDGVGRLRIFLALAFAAMAVLTVLTKHLLFPGLVNDANVGWWERGYAIVLVGWVAVTAVALDRRLRRQTAPNEQATLRHFATGVAKITGS